MTKFRVVKSPEGEYYCQVRWLLWWINLRNTDETDSLTKFKSRDDAIDFASNLNSPHEIVWRGTVK